MLPLQITIRSINDSPNIEYHVYKHYNKIYKLYQKITRCRVVIDVAQNHKHKGKIFSVNIDITIPGRELVSRKQNQNLYVAIRDGFEAIEKLLAKYSKRKPSNPHKHLIYAMRDNSIKDDSNHLNSVA